MSLYCAVIDGIGIYGNFLHYGLVITLVGSAFLIFLYLWKIKRLDIDEEPKFQMMQEDKIRECSQIANDLDSNSSGEKSSQI
jgi:hypothetical protein